MWHAGFYLDVYQESSKPLCSVIFKFTTPKLVWASPQDTAAILRCRNKTIGETSMYLWCGAGNTSGSRNNQYSQAQSYWARICGLCSGHIPLSPWLDSLYLLQTWWKFPTTIINPILPFPRRFWPSVVHR